MCGIFGVAAKNTLSLGDKKFLKSATMAGAVRGVDSTGYIIADPKNVSLYMKKAVNGTTFIQDHYDPTTDTGIGTTAIIGHNRAATMGSVDDDSAHPFVEGNVIGVHNGTLDWGWQGHLNVSKKMEIDSRGIYRAISSRGLEWTVKNLRGAAALVWQDLNDGSIHVWRNMQRPLYYAKDRYTDKLYFASEKGMLIWLTDRHNLTIEEPQQFKAHHHYTITDGDVVDHGELEVYVPPVVGRTYSKGQYIPYAPGATHTNSATQRTESTVQNVSDIGLRYQRGVPYRGMNVSDWERQKGIIAEYAELGYAHYTCDCCGGTITDSMYYETDLLYCSQEVKSWGDVKLHAECLEPFKQMVDNPNGVKVISFVRDKNLNPANKNPDNVRQFMTARS